MITHIVKTFKCICTSFHFGTSPFVLPSGTGVLCWKYDFKTGAAGKAAIVSTLTKLTVADSTRAGVSAGGNMAALFRGQIKFEIVPLGKNL